MSAPYQTQYQQQPQYLPPQGGQPQPQQQVYYSGQPQYAYGQPAPSQGYYQPPSHNQPQVVYQPPFQQQQPQQPVVYPAPTTYQQQHQPQPQPQQQQQQQYVQPSYIPPATDHFSHPHKAPLVNATGAHGGVPTPLSDEGDDSGRLAKPSNCKDVFWAILFIVHVIGIFALSMVLWKTYKNDMNTDNADTYHGNVNDRQSDFTLSKHAWELVGIVVAVAFVCSCLWLYLFKRYATCLIWTCLFLNSALLFFFTVWAFYIGVIFLGVICGIFFLLSLLYIYLVRHRIAFSSEILRLTVVVVQQYSNMAIPAYAAIFLQVGWLFVWTICAACAMHGLRKKGESDSSVGLVWFFLLVSLYWTAQVIKNVVHVTTAGVMASWYYFFPTTRVEDPVWNSFKRATIYSLGSIALGSLIIAVVQALRAVVRQAMRSRNEVVRCIVNCLMDMLESAVRYFNVYAFTVIAIYGKTYCNAAHDAMELLTGRGLTALVNDNLIGGVLFFASVADGLICALTAYVLAKEVWSLSYWGIYVFVAFLIGLIITLVAMELISSAVIAFFVCYADDPNALQQTKPGVYQDLQDAIHNYRGTGGRRPNDTIAAEQIRNNNRANGGRQQGRQQNQDALLHNAH